MELKTRLAILRNVAIDAPNQFADLAGDPLLTDGFSADDWKWLALAIQIVMHSRTRELQRKNAENLRDLGDEILSLREAEALALNEPPGAPRISLEEIIDAQAEELRGLRKRHAATVAKCERLSEKWHRAVARGRPADPYDSNRYQWQKDVLDRVATADVLEEDRENGRVTIVLDSGTLEEARALKWSWSGGRQATAEIFATTRL